MAPESYRELFAAIATTAGGLTGLLFVALSVRRTPASTSAVIPQIRAAAAMVCFVNGLAVSLFALVPTTSVGYPATVLGVLGLIFTAAAIRSVLAAATSRRRKLGQVGLFNLLILIFGVELVAGIIAITRPGDRALVQIIGYALISSLLVGISRAWEMIGDRSTGMFASISVLAGHEPQPEPPDDGDPGEGGSS